MKMAAEERLCLTPVLMLAVSLHNISKSMIVFRSHCSCDPVVPAALYYIYLEQFMRFVDGTEAVIDTSPFPRTTC